MGQAKRRGTFEQRKDAAIKSYRKKQEERDRELDRNYTPPYSGSTKSFATYLANIAFSKIVDNFNE